ncbi:MAG: TRAP transporter small permease [Clostridia bacterium]
MKLFKYAEMFAKVISMILLSVLVIITFAQIVSRFVFGISFSIIEELSMVLIAWCAFMSAAYAVKKKAHVSIDYFVLKLPLAVQKTVAIIIDITLFFSIGYILKFAYEYTIRRMKTPMPLMGIPNGIIPLAFVIAMFLICIFLLEDVMQRLKDFKGSIEG